MPAVIPAVRARVRPAALDVILRNRVRRARLPSAGTIWRLLIQCPKLKDVHVKGCRDVLIGAIRNQVLNEFAAIEPRLPCKRLADGSKRVHVPHFMIEQVCKTPSGLCTDQTKQSVISPAWSVLAHSAAGGAGEMGQATEEPVHRSPHLG